MPHALIRICGCDAIRGQGEGRWTRSFCYVDDPIEALVRLMASPEDFTVPVNLGNRGSLPSRNLRERCSKSRLSRCRI